LEKERIIFTMITTRNAGLLLGLGVLGTLSMVPAQAQFVVSYYNFNALTNNTAVDVTTITPNIGNGSLATSFLTDATDPNLGVSAFAGSTVNAEGADVAGQALALEGTEASGVTNSNNGNFLEIRTNTTNFAGLTLSFATRRTGTGFNSNQLSYSTNGGGSFTNFGAAYDPVTTTALALQSFDLSGIAGLNNNADVRFRVTFTGATSDAGNNRIDNLKVVAATPAPSSVAVMALGGLMPLVAIARRRRAAK
jgi:hypothetical protein